MNTNVSTLQVQRNRLGIEVLHNCDLNKISDRQVAEFRESLWEHGVVVVRNQQLTAMELDKFAVKVFGNYSSQTRPFELNPELNPDLQSPRTAILGNSQGLGEKISGKFAWRWHHDKDRLPITEGLDMNELYVVMLYGVKVPSEGLDGKPHTTKFLDMIQAYNNLSSQKQEEFEHVSLYHAPPVRPGTDLMSPNVPKKVHPVISQHKVTQREGLYLRSSSAIPVGMEDEPEEAKNYWQQLFETVLAVTPVYSHSWQAGDLIFWDNSQVMYAGTPYDATKHQRIALRLGIINSI